MTETELTRKIIAVLKKRGAWVYKVHGGGFSRSGVPDLLVCYNGKFHGLEVKLPTTRNTLTKLQELELKNIQKAGGQAIVVTSVRDAIQALDARGL